MRNEDEYARFVAAAARHATSFVPCWRDSVVPLSGKGHSSEEEILHDDKIRLEKAQGREDQPKSPLKEWKSKSGPASAWPAEESASWRRDRSTCCESSLLPAPSLGEVRRRVQKIFP